MNVVTFDYDPMCDTLTYDVYIEGKPAKTISINNFLEYLPNSTVVYKDDIQGYIDHLTLAMTKPMTGTFVYRQKLFGSPDDEYRLGCAHYVSVLDENGKVYRVVGRVDDVQE